MFPAGVPGIALILLRLSVITSLWLPPCNRPAMSSALLLAALMAISSLLLLGLATPVAATITMLILLIEPWSSDPHVPLGLGTIMHAVTALSLVLIGPGAFSFDARLFGRRVLTPP